MGPVWVHPLAFIAAFGVALSRRPDALWTPQFSAEGGTVFFAQAYNYGAASLAMAVPGAGYLQIFERSIALLASLFPLTTAPLIINVISLGLVVLPASLLLSSRFDYLGSVGLRAVLAFGYLALPSSTEVFVNLAATNVHLGLLACMLICASPADRPGWKIFDVVVLMSYSLAGPTVILLLPVVMVLWWFRRSQQWLTIQMLALWPGAIAQVLVVLLTFQNMRTSVTAPLGATPELLVQILSRQLFVAPLLGMWALPPINDQGYLIFSAIVVLMGSAAMAYALLKGPLPLKLLVTASVLRIAATLRFPLCSLTTPQWQVMVLPAACNRYWLIPMLAFLACLTWIAYSRRGWLRGAAVVPLLIMPVGIARDWRHPAWEDLHFSARAHEFAATPRGAHMVFPIIPVGWFMELIQQSGEPTAAAAANAPPFGTIDGPPPGAIVGRSVEFSGWALDDSRVSEVRIYVDGQYRTSVRLKVPRPDVTKVHPGHFVPGDIHGWWELVDLGERAGPHTLLAQAVDDHGVTTDIGPVTVSVIER